MRGSADQHGFVNKTSTAVTIFLDTNIILRIEAIGRNWFNTLEDF